MNKTIIKLLRKVKLVSFQLRTSIIELLILPLLIFSCTMKTNNLDPIPTATDPQKTAAAVGPFTIKFDTATSIFEHQVRILIDQKQGKIEYYLTTEKDDQISVESVNASVLGCDANLVKHQIFWFPSESSSSVAQLISLKTQFSTYAKIKGKILHSFQNLTGCKEIELKMRLINLSMLSIRSVN